MISSKKVTEERQGMGQSMPVSLPQFEQGLNANKGQYVTQNSMVENLGRATFESNYINY
jgi:hypothetical protein